ncbi:MAG: glycosyltransferase [Pyrobaculum sp.]
MNVAVVAPQTSDWEDSHRAAAILARAFLKLGHRAWLVAGVYHDGRQLEVAEVVERSEFGYVELREDPSGLPAVRVLSIKPLLHPAVSFRGFAKILSQLEETYGLDLVVVFSSFWNGPEEVAKWASIKRSLAAAGEAVRKTAYVYIPFYMGRARGRPIEAASRAMWTSLNMPAIIRNVDLVVASCREEAEELRQLRTPPEKILESRNWLDPELAEAIEGASPRQFGNVVSYIGPLEEEKNVRGLARLAEELEGRGIALAVAGRGEAAERLRQRPNVIYVERPGEVPALIKSSLAGVDLSHHEPAGIRALEFLYGGVPVAASPSSRASCHISNGVDGIYLRNSDDIQGVVRWVDMLTTREEVRREMGRKAREKARGLSAVGLAEAIARRMSAAG